MEINFLRLSRRPSRREISENCLLGAVVVRIGVVTGQSYADWKNNRRNSITNREIK